MALTEHEPEVRVYDEALWANLEDGKSAPIEHSLALLESLHSRWVLFLRSLKGADFERGYKHPEMGLVNMDKGISLYGWHGRHHVAHITALKERMAWQ